jgi:A/G-specific adenine glycosylase
MAKSAGTKALPTRRRKAPSVAAALLDWYDRNRRILPWRALSGVKPDPYRVWLSEIMLQQTTVKAVTPRFADFLRRWPNVISLAQAELGEVLASWAGLGYYARARNLHACARVVAEQHHGKFPDSESELRKLPGIGDYTAAAIAAIAFDRRASPVDGNIERVVARLFAVTKPLPAAKPELRELASRLTPDARAGDFAQGMMDLGGTICTPRRPACSLCPLRPCCAAYEAGLAEALPYRDEKKQRPTRRATAFVAIREDGAVLLRERPLRGLLGGMLEVPSSPWVEAETAAKSALKHAPLKAKWRELPGLVEHTFTHFHLELRVLRVETGAKPSPSRTAWPERCLWLSPRDFHVAALPSVMKKVLAHASALAAPSKLRNSASPIPAAPARAKRRSA